MRSPRSRQGTIRRLAAAVAAVVLGAGLLSTPAAADAGGTPVYVPTSASEANAYARMIELHHAGADTGRLLTTFEHWTDDGSPAEFIIRASDDAGATFSTLSRVPDPSTGAGRPVSHFWQPSLFESRGR